jgi:hypothetical protein
VLLFEHWFDSRLDHLTPDHGTKKVLIPVLSIQVSRSSSSSILVFFVSEASVG